MLKRHPLSEQLKRIWNIYRNRVRFSRKRANSKNVHDLRVATQKFQAILKLSQSIVPKPETKQLIQSLKKTRRKLGNLRDLHIESNLKETKVKHFSTYVGHEKKLAKKRVKKYLTELPLKEQKNLLAKVLNKKLLRTEKKRTLKQVRDLLDPAIQTTLSRFKKALAETTPEKMENLHRFRILAKQLRYQEEGMKAACGSTPFNLSKLKKVQITVGKIQDNNALLNTMNRYLTEKKHHGDPAVKKARKKLRDVQKRKIRKEFENLSATQWKS